MEKYNKLVRDKIPDILDKQGISYEKRLATPEELKAELIKKLQEEVTEFSEVGSPEELADVIDSELRKATNPFFNRHVKITHCK